MDDRTRALHEAKRADSRRKHDRTIATVKRLVDSGSRVSFARVAREANVSTWLVYNSTELKTTIQSAIDHQNKEGLKEAPARPAAAASNASLLTDLALARAEIKSLKHERDTLRKRIERVLGDEIREVDRGQLVERIAELEHLLRTAHSRPLRHHEDGRDAHRSEPRTDRTTRGRTHPQPTTDPPVQRPRTSRTSLD